jgi:hypothetical protein
MAAAALAPILRAWRTKPVDGRSLEEVGVMAKGNMAAETIKRGRTLRILSVGLYAQSVVAVLAGLGYLSAARGFAETEPISGRKAGVFLWAFAITLFIVARQLKSDRRWLLIPIFVTALNLCDTLFELVGRGDRNFIPPMVIEPTFLVLYAVGYWVLSRTAALGGTVTHLEATFDHSKA